MATYKEIHGVKVQYRDEDATAIEGDVWYNKSTGKLKMYTSLGSWASGTDLPGIRSYSAAFGTTTAAVWAGGYAPDPTGTYYDTVFEYDGSSWTAGEDLPATFGPGAAGTGIGTLTAGVLCGWYHASTPGGVLNDTLEYDGTDWTTSGDLPIQAIDGSSSGTQTAGLYITGTTGFPTTRSAQSCEYDGSSWTAGEDVNTIRFRGMGNQAGTQTAGMLIGGVGPSASHANVEDYDGTNWSEGPDLNTARGSGGGNGINTAAICYGGEVSDDSGTANVESYDGSSWTEVANLNTSRFKNRGVGGGVNTAALTTSGQRDAAAATTEVWSFGVSVQTVAFD